MPFRKACNDAGVHRTPNAGIQGAPTLGAYSVVLSGRYNDDDDNGETLQVFSHAPAVSSTKETH